MNISFTDKQQHYIATQVSGGDYQNASEVVRDALRLHEIYRNKVLEDLRAEITKGWDSKPSSHNIKDIINLKKVAKQKD
jgi:antitoxin ParD1/3/4